MTQQLENFILLNFFYKKIKHTGNLSATPRTYPIESRFSF